jgi:hypothetical protein
MRIWKYTLPYHGQKILTLPADYEVYSCAFQREELQIWVGGSEEEQVEVTFHTFMTGHEIDDSNKVYIGTAMTQDHEYVAHVFEEFEC